MPVRNVSGIRRSSTSSYERSGFAIAGFCSGAILHTVGSREIPLGANGKGWNKVMQFLGKGCYVANVVDGKVSIYSRREGPSR
jgi:hypothetical protein